MRNILRILIVVLLAIVLCGAGIAISKGFDNKDNEPETTYAMIEPLATSISPLTSDILEVIEPVYPISDEEIDLIALVTMAEAEGETELGKRLVIDTILNRVDHSRFPDTVTDVVYQPNQFSSMWNGRVDRCYVMPEIVELVKEELLDRTNYDCIFFTAGRYSKYGTPMFQECCHYFSSYE